MMDLMFLLAEKQEVPCHVGAILIFRRPRTGGARVTHEIVEAYRRFRPRPPFNRIPVFGAGGLPEWRAVDDIDPRRHVLHLQLPSPGSDEQLHELIADLHEPLLDRHRPGWKIYVIDGLADGRFAVYHKCHHSLVDGETGMQILQGSLSPSPQDRRIRPVVASSARASRPGAASRAPGRTMAEDTGHLAQRALSVGRGSLQAVAGVLEGLRGYTPEHVRSYTAPHTPMNDAIGASRSIAHLVLPLRRMKAVATRREATLNDVALAILDDAMHQYLRAMGRSPDHPLVAICPVALRHPQSGATANRLSTIATPLGEVTSNVAQRLERVKANTRTAKVQLTRLGHDTAYAYTVATFALTEALAAARLTAGRSTMLLGNAVLSNIRGPAAPLYLNRARLEVLFPISMLAIAVGLNTTMISYDGKVIFGFTANGSALPGIERLAQHVQAAFEQLERATAGAQRRPSRRRRTVRK